MKRIALIALGCAVAGAAAGFVAGGGAPAQAQLPLAAGGSSIEVSTTTVGATSHAYAVDTRMAQVIFCRAGAEGRPACTAVPLPGTAQRQALP